MQKRNYSLLVSVPARFDEVVRSTHKNSLMWDAYGQRCTEARTNLGGPAAPFRRHAREYLYDQLEWGRDSVT